MLDPILDKKNEIEAKFSNYLLKGRYRGLKIKKAADTSVKEIHESLQLFLSKPNPVNLANLLKNMFNSGVWLSKSYIELLFSLLEMVEETGFDPTNKQSLETLEHIANAKTLDQVETDANLFKLILGERRHLHLNPSYKPITEVKQTKVRLVLISGVFNEIFSTAAFERGAKFLKNNDYINFSTIKVTGTKSSRHNAELINEQLKEINTEKEKIWLLGYSKGGVDALHFLRSHYKEHPEIIGLSTIATPIMGTNHPNHKIIKMLTSFSRFKIYQFLDQGKDIFIQGLQNSLRSDVRHSWFFRNHEKLPKDIFYTALGFQAKWSESHVWMMLTKLLFQSKHPNDGVVDIQFAQFPSFFNAYNLGITEGHHLVGTRSSEYPQEALLEALLIFLKYKKELAD
tara:strand:- start:1098 stop:2294 length:1197 start_codon:yes stop_codon:yes gene_type:complete